MSGSADAAIGMMDGAYFVGRKELLDFFNDLLSLNLTKIEQTASGAIACQICDLIFPNSIPMSKVNWEARSDYEFIQNYKLLQIAFTKKKVQRYVDVDKLIRAKYQDNLEFCQWLKAFYDQAGVMRDDYDPLAVRGRGKGGKKYAFNASGGTGSTSRAPATKNPAARPRPAARTTATARTASSTATAARTTNSAITRPLRERGGVSNTPKEPAPAVDDGELQRQKELNTDLQRKNDDLTIKLVELEQAVIDIEKERDFYFTKLRDVEIMFQVHQEKGDDNEDADAKVLIDDVFKILYATAEDNLTVNDLGQVVPADEFAEEE